MTKQQNNPSSGLALPLVLLMLVIGFLASSIYMTIGLEGISGLTPARSSFETFLGAEAAVNEGTRMLSQNAQLFRERMPLASTPKDYTSFSPASYSGSNGLPSCTTPSCLLSHVPFGGGVIKTFGPLTGSTAGQIDGNKPLLEQLAAINPNPDLSSATWDAWYFMERLNEAPIGDSAFGTTLNSNQLAPRTLHVRLTGVARSKNPRTPTAESTIVTIVELSPQ